MKSLLYAIFLFAFFLPLSTNLSNILLFVAVAISGYYAFKQKDNNKVLLYKQKLLYSTISFFFLLLFGLILTNQIEDSSRFFERSLSFFLIPVVWLFLEHEDLLKIKKSLLKGLLFGSIVSIIILISLNCYRYFSDKGGFAVSSDLFNYYYTNLYFTKPFDIHPTYLGVYYLTCILFLRKVLGNIKIRFLILLLFSLALLFLNSRIIFIGFLLIIFRMIFLECRILISKKEFTKLFLGFFIACLIGFFAIMTISKTYIGSRLKNIYKFEMSTKKEEKFNSFNRGNSRTVRWISAINLIKERPFFGYGTADEYESLKKQFLKDGLYKAAKSRYNAHNQFLGYAIRFGVVGIATLLFFFIINIKLSLDIKDYHFLIFLSITVIINFVENFLDRNAGITFCAVFFTVFTYIGLYQKSKL